MLMRPPKDLRKRHTYAVKRASGNLSLTPIYKAYTEIVRLPHARFERAKKVLIGVLPIQNDIIECMEIIYFRFQMFF